MPPVFVFAPAAGAPTSHPWMQHWAQLLGTIGTVRPHDYPYMTQGRRRPDPLPQLIASHRAAIREARDATGHAPVLVGKSMGSRIGCHASLEEDVSALICFGYPLCGGGDPKKLRAKILREISRPILLVQGTRDSLCPLDLLESVRPEMTAPNELYVVEGGDHSLMVSKTQLKASGGTQETVDQQILQVIANFVAGIT